MLRLARVRFRGRKGTGQKLAYGLPKYREKAALPISLRFEVSPKEVPLYKEPIEPQIPLCSTSQSVLILPASQKTFHTIGERAKEPYPPLPVPLDLALVFPGQPLQRRSRSELSKVAADDVADSAAIFCS